MNHLPVILAHGALGIWDEVIFISIAAIFLVVMGISWVKNRVTQPTFHDETPPTDPASPSQPEPEKDSPTHFRLD